MQRIQPSATAFVLPAICALVVVSMSGCGGSSQLDSASAGKTLSYVPGLPNYDIEAVTAIQGGRFGIDLYLNIPANSYTFEKTADGFMAIGEFTVRVRNRDDRAFVLDKTWVDTTAVATYAMTQRSEPFSVVKHLSVPPGTYLIETSLEDRSTRKIARHVQSIVVPAVEPSHPLMSKIVLQSRQPNGAYTPVVTFHIPSGLDSLRAQGTIVNAAPASPIRFETLILKYGGDTAAAAPPYSFTALTLPIGYRQIDFDHPDTMYSDGVLITPSQSTVEVSYPVSSLPVGIYSIMMEARLKRLGTTQDTTIGSMRYFSIRGRTFPRPSTLDELVEPLCYIATDQEMKHLRAARTLEQKRARFDSLWILYAGNPQRAAELIKKYYTRVEEANRLFTTTKEGWKTDHGMLYVVLGPPIEITSRLDQETWYYNISGTGNDDQFIFKRIIATNDNLSFENYFLYRTGAYERLWDRMVAKWRSGEGF